MSILAKKKTGTFLHFLSGGGGVVHAIYQTVYRMLRSIGSEVDKPAIILTASTGKAAVNISGTTLHTAFTLPCRKRDGSSDYRKLSAQALNTLRCRYSQLEISVIDEISMMGAVAFQHFNRRLQDIYENTKPFGGISVLAVRDLFQLNPVGDCPVFRSSKRPQLNVLAPNIWQDLFKLHELTEIVRQKNDPEFAQLLSRIRVGEHKNGDISLLKDLEKKSNVKDIDKR